MDPTSDFFFLNCFAIDPIGVSILVITDIYPQKHSSEIMVKKVATVAVL